MEALLFQTPSTPLVFEESDWTTGRLDEVRWFKTDKGGSPAKMFVFGKVSSVLRDRATGFVSLNAQIQSTALISLQEYVLLRAPDVPALIPHFTDFVVYIRDGLDVSKPNGDEKVRSTRWCVAYAHVLLDTRKCWE